MESDKKKPPSGQPVAKDPKTSLPPEDAVGLPIPELYGPKGLEPTRYGDWEQKGRCTDF